MAPLPIARLAVEHVPPGEPGAIRDMIAALKQQLEKHYPPGKTRRDAHPKPLGLVTASFTVAATCPVELRHGVFKALPTFDAEIRFSNGHPKVDHDLKGDIRGMAIKLHGTPGPTLVETDSASGQPEHDFLLATGEAFFGRDAVDFVEFPQAADRGTLAVVWWVVRGRRLRGAWQLWRARKTPASPLDLEYFGQTPYRLGPHCVKYAARPRRWRPPRLRPWYMLPVVRPLLSALTNVSVIARWLPGQSALRDALARDLERGAVEYDFLVQRWPDLGQLPVWAIEDATRRWAAPWVKVATIEIRRQTAGEIASRDGRAETMSFSPWRVGAEHQPLGSISRARLEIYREMSAFRHKRNAPRSGDS